MEESDLFPSTKSIQIFPTMGNNGEGPMDLSQEMLAIARHKLAHSSVSRSAAASSPN